MDTGLRSTIHMQYTLRLKKSLLLLLRPELFANHAVDQSGQRLGKRLIFDYFVCFVYFVYICMTKR